MGRTKRRKKQIQQQEDENNKIKTYFCSSLEDTQNGMRKQNHHWDRNRDLQPCDNDNETSLSSVPIRNGHQYDNENCYNQLMQSGLEKITQKPTNWLNEIYTLGRTNKSNESTILTVSPRTTKSTHSMTKKKEDIEHLTNELNSIKRSLWPAAVQKSNRQNSRIRRHKRKFNTAVQDSNQSHINGTSGTQNNKNNTDHNYKTCPSVEFRLAREKCNPFEKLSKIKWIEANTKSFVCRSAMKLANIDAILGFKLTAAPTTMTGKTDGIPFKFVDLCGAPGGFSEYILRRREGQSFCGYGMSLIGENDDGHGLKWDLKTLSRLVTVDDASSSHNNYNHSGKSWSVCHGKDGTGDIYNWDNVLKLQNDIRNDFSSNDDQSQHCHDDNNDTWKADLVVADGGFDAQRDSECQESLAHAIVTCQTAASLVLLKKGGNFVVKMFGFQHSQTMMVHLYNSFEKIVILKPITSRPASAERYVVCINYDGLDPSLDVLSWRNSIMDSITMETTEGSAGTGVHINGDSTNVNLFGNYLHQIDCHMLHLNIQACAMIVSYLCAEEKHTLFHKKEENVEDDMKNDTAQDMDYFSFYQNEFDIRF